MSDPGIWAWLLGLGVLGAILITFRVGARMGRSYDARRAERESKAPVQVCSTCGTHMDYQGLRQVIGEDGSPFEMYTCPTCRKVEMFVPPAAVEDGGRANLGRFEEKT